MPPSSQKISHSAAHSAAEENIKTKKGSHSFGSRPKTDAIAHEQPAKDARLGAPSTRPAIHPAPQSAPKGPGIVHTVSQSVGQGMAQLGQAGYDSVNSGPMGASGKAVDQAAKAAGYTGISVSKGVTHGSIAAIATGRMLMEASGAKPTDVASQERAAYQQSRSQVAHSDLIADAHKRLEGGEAAPADFQTKQKLAATENSDDRTKIAQDHMAMYRAKKEQSSGVRVPHRLKARTGQLMGALTLGKAVQATGHRAGYEGTMQESANVLGASVKRGSDETTAYGPGQLPQEEKSGRFAQAAATVHRGISGVGDVMMGGNGRQALLKGENAKAVAQSAGGLLREGGIHAAGKFADLHGAAGFGETIADGLSKVAGGIVSGVGWGLGKVTGVEAAAKNQDNVDAVKKFTGEQGGVSRAQEIEDRGFHARPQANGLNDSEAGLPSIDFAKPGESWGEAREKAGSQGRTWKDNGFRGALSGLGAGLWGAARGAKSNVQGHSMKAFRGVKKMAKSGLSSMKSATSWLGKKLGLGKRAKQEDQGIEMSQLSH